MDVLFGIIVVTMAYFLKGFGGFGPALLMIPFFTLIYDPTTAIILTTLLDIFSGAYLFLLVRKEIAWRFVFSILVFLGIGALFGSLMLGSIPADSLKRIIGGCILVFAIIIFIQRNNDIKYKKNRSKFWRIPISLLSGFMGGMLSISGPPLVIYLKLFYNKLFFRTQLIAIFFFGAAWRLLLYQVNHIPINLSLHKIIIFTIIMGFGLWLGNHFQLKVGEVTFNRVIALILFIPAINLILI